MSLQRLRRFKNTPVTSIHSGPERHRMRKPGFGKRGAFARRRQGHPPAHVLVWL